MPEGFDVRMQELGSVGESLARYLGLTAPAYTVSTACSSGAHALAAGMLGGAPGAVDNYMAFLRAGSSLYPIDALKLAGVDLTTPEPVESAFSYLAGLVDQLEGLLGQGGAQTRGGKDE